MLLDIKAELDKIPAPPKMSFIQKIFGSSPKLYNELAYIEYDTDEEYKASIVRPVSYNLIPLIHKRTHYTSLSVNLQFLTNGLWEEFNIRLERIKVWKDIDLSEISGVGFDPWPIKKNKFEGLKEYGG